MNCVNPVAAYSSDGSITISFDEIPSDDSTFESSDGSITIMVPKGASLRYDLKTRDGRAILQDLDGTVVLTSEEERKNTAIGSLNNGEITMTARTRDGNITMRH